MLLNAEAFAATVIAQPEHHGLITPPAQTEIIVLVGLVVATTGWALWVRRDSWSSRWAAPMTASIAFQTFGAVLVTPGAALQNGLASVFGGPHVSNLIANLSYLLAAMLGVIGVYTRLLPDQWATPLLNKRVLQPLIVAAAIMVAAFTLSDAAHTGLPVTHLYFIPRDGWLTLYWITYYVAMQTAMITFLYGITRLDYRNVWTGLYRVAVSCAVVGSALQFIGLFYRPSLLIIVCWVLGYACTILMSLAAGRSWQHQSVRK